MAIEAELKAVVRDAATVRRRLEEAYGPGVEQVYRDTYYDTPDGELLGSDRELRIRTVDGGRHLLTFKGARVDPVSGSKPEHETAVTDPAAADAVVRGLGLVPRLAFTKHCRNHRFTDGGRELLATLVRVPELDGTFLEVETAAGDEDGLPAALAAVRAVLARLGIPEGDLTTELYTDAVAAARGHAGT
ncbi:class IV adenylate cyclase [Kitasatospora sp. NPDC004240]